MSSASEQCCMLYVQTVSRLLAFEVVGNACGPQANDSTLYIILCQLFQSFFDLVHLGTLVVWTNI